MEAAATQLRVVASHDAWEVYQESSPTMSLAKEQPVAAPSGEFWQVEDVRLYRSTDPNLLLFAPTKLTLERSGRNGRCQAALTQFRSLKDGLWNFVGGSALLLISSAVQPVADFTQHFAQRWRNALFEQGYTGNLNPVFLPMPRRKQRLRVLLDYETGYSRHLGEKEIAGETASVVVELTGQGAQEWGRMIREKRPVRGRLRWIYEYPLRLPDAEACFSVAGARITTHSQSEAGDLNLRLIFRARTWMETSLETDFTTLLEPLDESHLHVVPVEASSSFPVMVRPERRMNEDFD